MNTPANRENELQGVAQNPEEFITKLSQELRTGLTQSGLKDYEVDAIMARLSAMNGEQLTVSLVRDIPEITRQYGSETAFRVVVAMLVIAAAIFLNLFVADILVDQLQFVQDYVPINEVIRRLILFVAAGVVVWPPAFLLEIILYKDQLSNYRNLLRNRFLGTQSTSSTNS